jgi:hypothetical protein
MVHRRVRLLKQQSSIIVYRLRTKENKRPFLVSVCGFRFPLVPFSVCVIPETWRHGHGEVETWSHGDIET